MQEKRGNFSDNPGLPIDSVIEKPVMMVVTAGACMAKLKFAVSVTTLTLLSHSSCGCMTSNEITPLIHFHMHHSLFTSHGFMSFEPHQHTALFFLLASGWTTMRRMQSPVEWLCNLLTNQETIISEFPLQFNINGKAQFCSTHWQTVWGG